MAHLSNNAFFVCDLARFTYQRALRGRIFLLPIFYVYFSKRVLFGVLLAFDDFILFIFNLHETFHVNNREPNYNNKTGISLFFFLAQ